MNDLLVAFSGYSRTFYQPMLEQQLSAAEIPWIYYRDKAFSWRRRTLWQSAVASAHPHHLIAFIDSTDFLLMGTADELRAAIQALGPLSFAAQKDCWPHPEKAALYDKVREAVSPWRYLNSCGPAGRGWAISEAIDYAWERYPIQTDDPSDTDERFYTDLFLEGFGVLDQGCLLTQLGLYAEPGELVVRNGRILNTVTQSWPVFLHVDWRRPLPEGLRLPTLEVVR